LTISHRKRQNVSAEARLFPTDEGTFFRSTASFGKVFARVADDAGRGLTMTSDEP